MWNGLNEINMVVTFHKAHWIPIIVFIWFPATFLITYGWAVITEDVPLVFPYISDTGTFPPEACIFGQLLNTGSILMAVVIYLRYRHVVEMLTFDTIPNVKKLNDWSLWLGFFASFGTSVVGNFQETNMFTIHIIGAGMAFGLGTVYQVLQTIVSWRMYPVMGTKSVNITRCCLAAICIVCTNLTFIFAVLSLTKFDGDDITKWTSQQDGYEEHLASAITEWITAFCTMGFILTFANEFRYFKVVEPEFQLVKQNSATTEVERF